MAQDSLIRRVVFFSFGVLVGLAVVSHSYSASASDLLAVDSPVDEPNFVEHVLPLLRRHCFRCHGDKNQEAGLRLDRVSSLLDVADSDETIVVPGESESSLLLKRVSSDAYGEQMPPDAPALSKAELQVIERWIAVGAKGLDESFEVEHWAYRPITRPQSPHLSSDQIDDNPKFDVSSPIDAFVRQQLIRRNLQPAGRAKAERLLRRVSLVLTGLPPTLEQLDQFLRDPSPLAYERAVDRMLASEQFGERWATPWLDLARYADSNGFQADQIRDNWAYRDWLINALNNDMPFDQFVIEQLAGDLLLEATVEQRIATGFHRMTTCNVEAGVHPEANRVNQVVDRVNTTGTVFMGTTIECAQCHDHKYDPFTQEDYYKLFAYFNNTPLEVKQTAGVTWDFYGPTIELPLDETEQRRRDDLLNRLQAAEASLRVESESSDFGFDKWLSKLAAIEFEQLDWQPAIPDSFTSTGNESFTIQDDGSVLLEGPIPDKAVYELTFSLGKKNVTGIRLDTLTDPAIPGNGPGRGDLQRTNFVLHELACELIVGDQVKQLALVNPVADFSQAGWDVAGAIDGDLSTGWAINPQFGKPHWASFQFAEPIVVESSEVRLRIRLEQHYGQGRVIGKPRISFYEGDPELQGVALKIEASKLFREAILDGKLRTDNLTAKQKKELRKMFDEEDPGRAILQAEVDSLKKRLEEIKPATTLVMEELEESRQTFVMLRGDYEQLGVAVSPGTPAALPQLSVDNSVGKSTQGNRLDLAHWLVARENPLVARVTVNRWWSQIFGRGLVTTPEDFGTQAEPPTHPELFDWLACELMDSDWSMKHVVRQIVLSDTFCQAAGCSDEALERDPANQWLARGPRYRLNAETIRDNALAITGMLSNSMYGPPVMPHQPAGLWRSIGRNQPTWVAAEDENRFRRGLYVVFKRASPYPSFVNFDSPDRGSCTVQRTTTNTPLQALTLLNDPAYVELALVFADRLLNSDASSDEERINMAMRLAVSRDAEAEESEILRTVLEAERQLLREKPQLVKQRTNPRTKALKLQAMDNEELAAWFAVTSVILNLDETINL